MNVTRHARRSPDWLDAQRPLAQWYASGLGESILSQLEATLRADLGDVFGYQGLQVGNLAGDRHLLAGAGLHRRLMLDAPPRDAVPLAAPAAPVHAGAPGAGGAGATATDTAPLPGPAATSASGPVPTSAPTSAPASGPVPTATRPGADIHADVLSLPIASGSMKAVLFFHTLDFCRHPHRALREADRVLTDDGQLIIVGFNPCSAFGVRHFGTLWRRREPWNGRFWSRGRVADWLSVLDYRVLDSRAMYIRPPFNSERLLRRLRKLERLEPWLGGLGGLYVVRARKQTLPMTPVRRQQRLGLRPGIAAAGLARSRKEAALPSNVARVDFRKR